MPYSLYKSGNEVPNSTRLSASMMATLASGQTPDDLGRNFYRHEKYMAKQTASSCFASDFCRFFYRQVRSSCDGRFSVITSPQISTVKYTGNLASIILVRVRFLTEKSLFESITYIANLILFVMQFRQMINIRKLLNCINKLLNLHTPSFPLDYRQAL
jgi:hypothetical protein